MTTQSRNEWFAKYVSEKIHGEERKDFLTTLKNNPEVVVQWVAQNIREWCTLACAANRQIVIGNVNEAAAVVEHFKKYFEKELT